ncbi:MAG: hypothetical protein K0S88_3883 [Actinomycetia bacterium]|jgi:hypothetical protein|nr:hypothetical protein [Actinomycetes bacterium]
MSSRYLGVITLERFLVAERYCESRQTSSTDPRRTPNLEDRGGGRGDRPGSRTGTGAPAQARHG